MNNREYAEYRREYGKIARMMILQACQTGFNIPGAEGGDMLQPSRLFSNRPLWYDYMVPDVQAWMDMHYFPHRNSPDEAGPPERIHGRVERFGGIGIVLGPPTPKPPVPKPERDTLTKHEPVTLEDGRPGARIDMTEVLTEDERMAEDAMYPDPFEDYYDYD